jgi:hypothetical protein
MKKEKRRIRKEWKSTSTNVQKIDKTGTSDRLYKRTQKYFTPHAPTSARGEEL